MHALVPLADWPCPGATTNGRIRLPQLRLRRVRHAVRNGSVGGLSAYDSLPAERCLQSGTRTGGSTSQVERPTRQRRTRCEARFGPLTRDARRSNCTPHPWECPHRMTMSVTPSNWSWAGPGGHRTMPYPLGCRFMPGRLSPVAELRGSNQPRGPGVRVFRPSEFPL